MAVIYVMLAGINQFQLRHHVINVRITSLHMEEEPNYTLNAVSNLPLLRETRYTLNDSCICSYFDFIIIIQMYFYLDDPTENPPSLPEDFEDTLGELIIFL